MFLPVIVSVLVPFVKVVPVPDVFQLPETVQAPDVNVIVPLVADVIVTLPLTVTVLALAVKVPRVPMVTPAAVIPRLEPEVVRTVDPVTTVCCTVNKPSMTIA